MNFSLTPKVIVRILIYEYVGLFGLALAVAGFLRVTTPFLMDAVIEVGTSLIGVFLLIAVAQAEWKLLKGTAKKIFYSQRLVLLAAIVTVLLVILIPFLGLPPLIAFVFAAGLEFGSLLLRIVDTVFSGKLGLDWVGTVFVAIPWVFQFIFVAEIISWIQSQTSLKEI